MNSIFNGFIDGDSIKVKGVVTESSSGLATNGSNYVRGKIFVENENISWIGFDRKIAPQIGNHILLSGKVSSYKGNQQIQIDIIEDVVDLDLMPKNKKLIAYYRNCIEKEFQGSVIKADLSKLPRIKSDEEGLVENMNLSSTLNYGFKSNEYNWFKKVSLTGLDASIMLGYPILKKIKSDGTKTYAPLAYIETNVLLNANDVTLTRISDSILWNYGALEILGIPLEERDYIKDRLDTLAQEFDSDTERLAAGLAVIENYTGKEMGWDNRFDIQKLTLASNLEIIYGWEVCFDGQSNAVYEYLLKDLGDLLNKSDFELSKGPLSVVLTNATNKIDSSEYRILNPLLTNNEQNIAILNGLKSTLSCVTGPPGTGKSQFVANLASTAVANGLTVLIASKNNQAVDVAVNRLRNAIPTSWPIRAGNKENKINAGSKLYEAVNAKHVSEGLSDALFTFEEIQNSLYEKKKYLANYDDIVDELKNTLSMNELEISKLSSELQFYSEIELLDISRELDLLRIYLLAPLKFFRKNKQINQRKVYAISKFTYLEEKYKTHDLSILSKTAIASLRKDNLDILSGCFATLKTLFDKFSELKLLESNNTLYKLELSLVVPYSELEEIVNTLVNELMGVSKNVVRLSWDELVNTSHKLKSLETLAISLGSGYVSNLKNQIVASLSVSPVWAITNLSAYNNLPLESGIFDLVIIDEASQCDIASVLPLLYRAKKAILVGDPNQLQHITSVKVKDSELIGLGLGLKDLSKEGYNYTENSAFALCRRHTETSTILKEHYRSHPAIAEFANRFVYNGELDIYTNPLNYQKGDGIFWHNIKGTAIPNWEGASLKNQEEAKMVIKLIGDLVKDNAGGTIGVVTPFKEQADIIIKEIAKVHEFRELDIRVATAHKFQGDERDIIILSTVISTNTQIFKKEFANNLNLVNVSITRARRQLHVVGDREICSDVGGLLGGLVSYCESLYANGFESPAEEALYNLIDRSTFTVVSQEAIGVYHVDFLVTKPGSAVRLVIECDGHPFHRNLVRDSIRDEFLIWEGYQVVHIAARDCLKNPNKVLKIINSYFG